MPGQMLDEIGAYYQAFAYQPSIPEPPDHIAVMTGFIAYLRLKEALGNAEQAEITAKAARDFLDNHLNIIAEPLAKSLEHSGVTYLAGTAAALLKRVGPRRQVGAPIGAEADCAGCQFSEEETDL